MLSRRPRTPHVTSPLLPRAGAAASTPPALRAAHLRPRAGPRSRSCPGRDEDSQPVLPAGPGTKPSGPPLPPKWGHPSDLQTQALPARRSRPLSCAPPAWARRPPGSAPLCVSRGQRPRGPLWSGQKPGASFPHLLRPSSSSCPLCPPTSLVRPLRLAQPSPAPPGPSTSPRRHPLRPLRSAVCV